MTFRSTDKLWEFLFRVVVWCSALKHSDSCADANLARQVPKIENKSRKNLGKHHLPGNARKTAL